MRTAWTALGLVVALAGCDGTQPLQFGDPQPVDPAPVDPVDPEDPNIPPTTSVVPAVTAGNLRNASYNPADETLTVTVYALDGSTPTFAYDRNPALDVPGFVAFSYQDDPLDRMFIGYGDESPDGAMRGALVVSGGQFNRYFGGVDYERTAPYSQPASGLVSFAGDYVGILNIGYLGDELLPVPPDTAVANLPTQPYRVEGRVFLNVDWNDSVVNGAIYDRELADDGRRLTDLALTETTIGTSGAFQGSVEPDGEAFTAVGRYTGLFGGTGASSVAGGMRLQGDFTDLFDREEEYGVFVLGRCGLAGDAPICDSVNP